MNPLVKETKKLVEQIPAERLVVAKIFLEWLREDNTLSKSNLKKVLQGEDEIRKGQYLAWRKIARTI